MRHTVLRLVAVAGLFAAPSAVLGQQAMAPAPAQRAAMQRFDRWIGTWRGAGWSTTPGGERIEFNLVETVEGRVGGSVLLLQGRGTGTSGSAAGQVTHDGLVVLYYDEKTGQYRWDGHEAGRPAVDVEATPVDGGLAWILPVGDGAAAVRFTITFDERRWHEVGEFSADGRSWVLFMEMNLSREPSR